MKNRAFYPEKIQPPLGLYAHGVEVPENAKLTFTAGQVGIGFDGNLPNDFATQARNAWENCIAILEHNQLRINDVIKINHFVTDPKHLPIYKEVRATYLGECRPASTLLIVLALADPDFLIEIEMIAASTRRG